MYKSNQSTVFRKVREEHSISIGETARDLNIKKGVLQEIECAKKSTNAERAKMIANYFNLPVEELFIATYYRARST
ncbi:transcriptional regulator [[Bacillus thuringiensis] serovar konkukian]|nr:helix-turn-helix transcriptional regulator [Bacillus thuringiensis]MED1304076.1 helix-turn-helix transcriptional regulator [Bacillus pacificus]OUA91378.1 transcriptional regulator [[Bacillus thuringiensis] serovar konkukian]